VLLMSKYKKRKNDPRDSRAWRALRKTILARDGYVCAYCGQDADTVDHVVSVKESREMAMSPDNLVSACKRCNSIKGARSEGVFLARKFTPPVFSGNISPMQSEPMQDSPFKIRPNPNQ
jgi:5-methylcytosine-specific restriction endonuclease McrA